MMRIIFAILISTLALPAAANLSINDLAKQTGSPTQLSGDFEQDKYIKSFDTHILSNGHFKYIKNKHMHWNTVSPVENLTIMTPTSIASKQGDNELVNLQADKNPTIKVLSKIFFAVLTAEWETLNEYFTSAVSGNSASWAVTLTPKNALLAQSINQVELFGNSTLQKVILYEKNGDSTHISFSNVTE